MINASTYIKTITNAQMAWLIKNRKVWWVESEGMYFSRNNCYIEKVCTLDDPKGGWEVHK